MQEHRGSGDGKRAEHIYAQFLAQLDEPEGISFERFLAHHPDNARQLLDIHAGMGRVNSALTQATARISRPRRIGLDLDHTISAMPQWFSILSRAFLSNGYEIHVITDRPPDSRAEVCAELERYQVPYTQVHLPGPGVDAPTWKSELAECLRLDLMIEDSPEVLFVSSHQMPLYPGTGSPNETGCGNICPPAF